MRHKMICKMGNIVVYECKLTSSCNNGYILSLHTQTPQSYMPQTHFHNLKMSVLHISVQDMFLQVNPKVIKQEAINSTRFYLLSFTN